MAENQANITTLKDTLYAQQQLLQKLYGELDVERESSATAVSEALSMILKLQGEKSAVMMEASQYKRMTEEEISHAEETLAIYEDLMYQKEMDISALELQVEAYKDKLVSLGCDDLDETEDQIQENIALLRSDEEVESSRSVRKLKSLPALTRQRSLNSALKMMEEEEKEENDEKQKIVLRMNSGKSTQGEVNSYWDEIRRLDERVRAIADGKFSRMDSRKYEVNSPSNGLESGRLSCVYDIYEVKDISEDCKTRSDDEKRRKKVIWEGENRLGKPDPVIEEVFDEPVKDESECVKKPLLIGKEATLTSDASVQCNLALLKPIVTESNQEDKLETLSKRIQRLEKVKTPEFVRQGPEDYLKLLRDIRGQLDLIKCEMSVLKEEKVLKVEKVLKEEKSTLNEDNCLITLRDALLCFWA